jgi:hypothetical protein
MRIADSKSTNDPMATPSPQSAARAVPTFIATDLLERLIADRDARAVDKALIDRLRA